MYPPGLQNYPQEIKELHKIFMEAGIYRQYNWYDFLKELLKCFKIKENYQPNLFLLKE